MTSPWPGTRRAPGLGRPCIPPPRLTFPHRAVAAVRSGVGADPSGAPTSTGSTAGDPSTSQSSASDCFLALCRARNHFSRGLPFPPCAREASIELSSAVSPLPSIVACIREEILRAPHGERGREVRRLARLFGVSTTTVYRWARLGGTPRPRRRAAGSAAAAEPGSRREGSGARAGGDISGRGATVIPLRVDRRSQSEFRGRK